MEGYDDHSNTETRSNDGKIRCLHSSLSGYVGERNECVRTVIDGGDSVQMDTEFVRVLGDEEP